VAVVVVVVVVVVVAAAAAAEAAAAAAAVPGMLNEVQILERRFKNLNLILPNSEILP